MNTELLQQSEKKDKFYLPVEQLKKSIQEYELMKQDEAKYCIS